MLKFVLEGYATGVQALDSAIDNKAKIAVLFYFLGITLSLIWGAMTIINAFSVFFGGEPSMHWLCLVMVALSILGEAWFAYHGEWND